MKALQKLPVRKQINAKITATKRFIDNLSVDFFQKIHQQNNVIPFFLALNAVMDAFSHENTPFSVELFQFR